MSSSGLVPKVDPRLAEIFQSVIGVDNLELRPEMGRRDVPNWDSMAHIQLVLAVESHFGFKFAPHEIAKFATVGQLWDLIVVNAGLVETAAE